MPSIVLEVWAEIALAKSLRKEPQYGNCCHTGWVEKNDTVACTELDKQALGQD